MTERDLQDNRAVFPNAFTDWMQMIPVESGSSKVVTWVKERRNLQVDYRQAVGENPAPIN